MPFDKYNPNEESYMGKLVLRWISLILAAGAVGTAGYSYKLCLVLLPGAILSLIWNFSNIIKRLSSAWPIHPGANVAFDLILYLWMMSGFAFASIAAGMATAGTKLANTLCSDGNPNCSKSDGLSDLQIKAYVAFAAVGCASFLCLFHFILFVWACVDTHRLRRAKREAMLVKHGRIGSGC